MDETLFAATAVEVGDMLFLVLSLLLLVASDAKLRLRRALRFTAKHLDVFGPAKLNVGRFVDDLPKCRKPVRIAAFQSWCVLEKWRPVGMITHTITLGISMHYNKE